MQLVLVLVIGLAAGALAVGIGMVNWLVGFLAMFPIYKGAAWLMQRSLRE